MKTKRELRVTWGPGHTPMSRYTTTIPAGHPVTDGGMDPDGSRVYWAKPSGLGLHAFEHHDATHYGIRIPASEVEA